MIPVARPILGQEEIDAVAGVLQSGNLAQGRLVEQFERRFAETLGARHAVAVSTGTAALHIALLAHGVQPGDEVITTTFSFVGTANAVLYTGAKPVFVDIRPDTFNIDPALIERRITARTKAIIPVHLYGLPADMPAITEIAGRHGVSVIEDAAQAHGAAIGNQQVGSSGTACFSFYATKNVTTAEGGIVTTDNDQVAENLRMLRSHGQRERYYHEILGYNYRMTEVHAAIGLVQLDRLAEITRKRIANAEYLNSALATLETQKVPEGYKHVYHQYTVRIPNGRDQAIELLRAAGVGTAIHYPLPIHRQPLYLGLGYSETLPIAETASQQVLSLPVHPGLTRDELDVVAREVSALPRRLWQ